MGFAQIITQKKIRHLTAKWTRKLIISFQLSCLEKKSQLKKIIFAEIKLNHPALLSQASQVFLHLQPAL